MPNTGSVLWFYSSVLLLTLRNKSLYGGSSIFMAIYRLTKPTLSVCSYRKSLYGRSSIFMDTNRLSKPTLSYCSYQKSLVYLKYELLHVMISPPSLTSTSLLL